VAFVAGMTRSRRPTRHTCMFEEETLTGREALQTLDDFVDCGFWLREAGSKISPVVWRALTHQYHPCKRKRLPRSRKYWSGSCRVCRACSAGPELHAAAVRNALASHSLHACTAAYDIWHECGAAECTCTYVRVRMYVRTYSSCYINHVESLV